ncbi:MAG: 4-alpha-glucanotransferase [Thermoplasmata archaeon]
MVGKRQSGILVHPTSLPSDYGIGDMGPEAVRFLKFLLDSGCSIWQFLPLNATGFGNSPYSAVSAFAGNPLLISPDVLIEEGYLKREQMESPPSEVFRDQFHVNYDAVGKWKERIFRKVFENYKKGMPSNAEKEFSLFIKDSANWWLKDFALYMALKDENGGRCWAEWEPDLVKRQKKALEEAEKRLSLEIEYHSYLQYLFFKQWDKLMQTAKKMGILLIGDIPIFVNYDSADVWANQEIFQLDENRKPLAVSGVPPDYFSKDGQLWGNPLYDWEKIAPEYSWWIQRFKNTLRVCDVVRIDHFRGFEAYWSVPPKAKTAREGKWIKGPGEKFFRTVEKALGGLPLIAEDLGIITPEVNALKDSLGLPGMKILQFAFGAGADNAYLPHNHIKNCIVYTGTHDNETTLAWLSTLDWGIRKHITDYMGFDWGFNDNAEFVWQLIRLGMSSVADTFIVPLQDVLTLGQGHRMNTPSESTGNWTWRCPKGLINENHAKRLRRLNEMYQRLPSQQKAKN